MTPLRAVTAAAASVLVLFVRATSAISSLSTTSFSLKYSLDISGNDAGTSYYIEVAFGADASTYNMVIDTYSYDLWVYSSSCMNTSCVDHNSLGSDDSSTLTVNEDETWAIAYYQGTVSGVVGNDYVSFAGYNTSMGFGLAESVPDAFDSLPLDGIIGMAHSAEQMNGNPTVMYALYDSSLIPRKVFSIDLGDPSSSSSGSMTLGGVDTSRFTGSVSYVSVANSSIQWLVDVDDAYVNGTALGFSGKSAYVDTGTTYTLMPSADALVLHAAILAKSTGGGDGVVRYDGENYVVPCNVTSTIAFGFAGAQWTLQPEQYLSSDIGDGLCVTNIQGRTVDGANVWLMGSSFIGTLYVVFDMDADQVGFAKIGSGGTDPYNDASAAKAASTTLTVASMSSTSSSITTSSTTSSSSTPTIYIDIYIADSTLDCDDMVRGFN
ncbi:aspartic peptidase domain-containing protein [Limtongia smithiae]|uniref:aspartic peptidase domain-containing protein n=1 Tax=Limtongia smithiae TaxID=1125753 RepID=UPI0034CD79FC